MYAYQGQPFDNNADGSMDSAYQGLPFVANLTAGANIYSQALEGTLSFAGSVNKITNLFINSTLSFAGAASKSTDHLMSGILSFADGTGFILLAWDASDDPNVTGYYVYWDTVSHNNSSALYSDYANFNDVAGRLSDYYMINGLDLGVNYYITITSHGAGGHDEFESELNAEIVDTAVASGSGRLIKTTTKIVAGALLFFTVVGKQTSKFVDGVLSFIGALTVGQLFFKSIAGVLSFSGSGSVSRLLGFIVNPSVVLSQVAKSAILSQAKTVLLSIINRTINMK